MAAGGGRCTGHLSPRDKTAVQAGRGDADHPRRRQARAVGGAIGGAGGAVGLRQIDAAAYRGPARDAPTTARSMSAGAPTSQLSDAERTQIRAHRHRLRLSVAPAAAGILRAGKCHAAADDPRPQARRDRQARRPKSWPISASATASSIGRRNCPAASSSASRSRARSPTRRACCSPTSRPAISTRIPPITCSGALMQLVKATRVAMLIATHNMELAGRMDRRVSLSTARSSSSTDPVVEFD